MKKIKLLMPMATITSSIAVIAPLASCSKTVVEEGFKVTLAPESADEIKIKETKCELNKDSTITLDVPLHKGAKITYIIVGTTRIETSAYTFDGEVITIKAAAMTSKNVEIFVSASNVVGLKAKVEKTYEALQTFKAEDLKVYPVYDDETVTTKALVWNEGYKIYDSEETEVENFDTTGYTFNRDEARAGGVEFTLTFAPYTRYTSTIKVNVIPRMEAASIENKSNTCVFNGDTITSKNLIINATMTDGTTRLLSVGTEYTVWDDDKNITDKFMSDGYTFTKEGKHKFTIKTVDNPEEAITEVSFIAQPKDMKGQFCMTNTSENEATVSFSPVGTQKLQYSLNGGTWTDFTSNISLPGGSTLMLKGDNQDGFGPYDYSKHSNIKITSTSTEIGKEAKVNLYGSALSLLNNNDPTIVIDTLPNGCFYRLFRNSNALAAVSNDFLPFTKLGDSAYREMFRGCTALTSIPEFVKTTSMADSAYRGMFRDCTNLIKINQLPNTTLSKHCYRDMFQGCKSLKTIPEDLLPATELADFCYSSMFVSCSIETIPEKLLHATKLDQYCYNTMFGRCPIKTIPEKLLPATTLAEHCYDAMFSYCNNLTSIPEKLLHATTLAEHCYDAMFSYCNNLTSIPEKLLPATTLAPGCYWLMFSGCKNLASIPEKLLHATTLVEGCYNQMFSYCNKLISLPDNLLPATTLADDCYFQMFYQCEALETVPKNLFPSFKEIGTESCMSMFENCYVLKSAPQINFDCEPGKDCFDQMFRNCDKLNVSTTGDDDHKIINVSTKAIADACTEMFYNIEVKEPNTYYWN